MTPLVHRCPGQRGQHGQRGSTLLITLIFLLIFAVMAVAVFRNSLSSVQAIGNMQFRNEGIAAANDAIDRLLSTADFATNSALITQQVNAAPFQFDANGDGVNDIAVSFPVVTMDGVARAGPRCLRAEPIPNTALDPDKTEDKKCFAGGGQDCHTEDQPDGSTKTVCVQQQLCANTEWSLTVRATDAVTNTSVDVVQGVAVRVHTSAVPTCN
jgi:type II secretory pathway pseudopilin PulG